MGVAVRSTMKGEKDEGNKRIRLLQGPAVFALADARGLNAYSSEQEEKKSKIWHPKSYQAVWCTSKYISIYVLGGYGRPFNLRSFTVS